jgi:putative transposase
MAQQHYRTPFKKALLQFITEPDPFLAMLKWVMTEMMRIEAEAKVGVAKGKHAQDRTTYFSGARARRVDTRLGTVYLLVPKVRKGGCVLSRENTRKNRLKIPISPRVVFPSAFAA